MDAQLALNSFFETRLDYDLKLWLPSKTTSNTILTQQFGDTLRQAHWNGKLCFPVFQNGCAGL
jgi:hypothetical protein